MAAFTTIAAGIGLAVTAGTTTMSFVQAGNQKKAQRQAERDADQAMQEARKKLEVNYYDTLSIQKEPYELEREALLSQGAQAIQAGVESERGAAATAGRVQMAMNEGQWRASDGHHARRGPLRRSNGLMRKDRKSNPKTVIVGFAGKARSGKGTAARMLHDLWLGVKGDAHILPFAKPIKDFAFLLGWNGKKDKKGRRLLQLLGTEIGRKCFRESFWIDKWWDAVGAFEAETRMPLLVISDDVRFDNEAEAIRSMGGLVVELTGRGGLKGDTAAHKSEQGINPKLIDVRIDNSGPKRNLIAYVSELFHSL
jgi:hypothetical protein